MKKLLDVVIVNWNSEHLLIDCLSSIVNQEFRAFGEIVVIDNSNTIGGMQDKLPKLKVRILSPSENLGFGAGCNLGARHGKAAFILFLNPDIRLQRDSVAKVMAYVTSENMQADAGIVGIRLIGTDGQVQRMVARFPRFRQLFARMLALERLFPTIFPTHYRHDLDYGSTQVVEQVPGAFLLIKRDLFEQLGGFDERFFMYYEDVDLCYRAFLSGWQTLYYAGAEVVHGGGGSTDAIRDVRLFYSLRSRVLYAGKHFGRGQALAVLAGILTLEWVARMAQALLRLSASRMREVWRAYGMLIRDARRMVRQL